MLKYLISTEQTLTIETIKAVEKENNNCKKLELSFLQFSLA